MGMSFWDFYSLIEKEYDFVRKRIMSECKLTSVEVDVLLFLSNNPKADTASDVVKTRKITKSYVSLAVKQLMEKEYLIRKTEDGNQKSLHLIITPKATKVVNYGKQMQREFLNKMFKGFTKQEKEEFYSFYERIAVNLRKDNY